MAEHAALATKHIIAAQSGHWVHLDEPELVVEAIRERILNLKF
jgi:pimeloyl-ACP methyl ester carboxylesterase